MDFDFATFPDNKRTAAFVPIPGDDGEIAVIEDFRQGDFLPFLADVAA